MIAAPRARELAGTLVCEGVRVVAVTCVDNAGVTRVNAVPVDRLEAAASWGVGMSSVIDVFCADDSITTSANVGGPVGDLRLFADLEHPPGRGAATGRQQATTSPGKSTPLLGG